MKPIPEEFTQQDPEQGADASTEAESKSQRKRNAHQITDLAARLVDMKPKILRGLPIEPEILEAIRHCAEIRSHGARKRQLHFVSKLLRESDNLQELQETLLQPKTSQKIQTVNPHLEFRNKLLEDLSGMVEALREHYPDIELQQVRQLVRNAHAECKKAQSKTQQNSDETKLTPDNTKAAKSLLNLLSASS